MIALLVAGLPLTLACSRDRYRRLADQETYRIIEQKAESVPNMEQDFSIEEEASTGLDDCPVVSEEDPALGPMAGNEVGGRIISLEKALLLAVRHNRTYQQQKEAVFLAALNLTLDRHDFTPIFSGSASGEYNRSTRDVQELSTVAAFASAAPDIVTDVGNITGTPGDLVSRYSQLVEKAVEATGLDETETKIVDERSVTGQTGVGVDLLLKGGAAIAVDLTSNFLRFLTGDPRIATSSALAATIRQPLLRGAGSKVAAEALTQSERDALYAIREYVRYRKEFTVDIASSYYQVLQSRDVVYNNYLSYQAFRESAERDRALVAEGRHNIAELGRIQQAELNAENGWTSAIRSYRQRLDDFKIRLGLPVDMAVVLDQGELEHLRERGLIHFDISPEDAIEVALVSRLDLYNEQDAVEDAGRKVEVAANNLKTDLDLVGSVDVDSKEGDRFQELDFERTQWSAGLDLDLPLDRKAERNAYRASLISFARSEREYSLAVDTVKLEVRDAWRNLDQAKRTYAIRQLGVGINEQRVEEQELRAELGQGDAIDLVDARNDLTQARNDLTSALVSHTIARLAFWRDMGILYIKEDGQWEEVTDDNPA